MVKIVMFEFSMNGIYHGIKNGFRGNVLLSIRTEVIDEKSEPKQSLQD